MGDIERDRPTLTIWFDGDYIRGVKGAFLTGPHDQELEAAEYVPASQLREAADDLRAVAEALDRAGVQRKIGTLSLSLVERVELLDARRPTVLPTLEQAAQWCPVCKTYHRDVGEATDAGVTTRACPNIPTDDPRYFGSPVYTGGAS